MRHDSDHVPWIPRNKMFEDSISQEICTRFCCALLCCGYAIVHNEFTWSMYPYHQGCFAGTVAIVRLPQCQWSKPDGYGKISQCITTTKHSKAKTVCIFLGIYCIWSLHDIEILSELLAFCQGNVPFTGWVSYLKDSNYDFRPCSPEQATWYSVASPLIPVISSGINKYLSFDSTNRLRMHYMKQNNWVSSCCRNIHYRDKS